MDGMKEFKTMEYLFLDLFITDIRQFLNRIVLINTRYDGALLSPTIKDRIVLDIDHECEQMANEGILTEPIRIRVASVLGGILDVMFETMDGSAIISEGRENILISHAMPCGVRELKTSKYKRALYQYLQSRYGYLEGSFLTDKIVKLHVEIDDPFKDNERIALESDAHELNIYQWKKKTGCCGFCDRVFVYFNPVTDEMKRFYYGFNWGH